MSRAVVHTSELGGEPEVPVKESEKVSFMLGIGGGRMA